MSLCFLWGALTGWPAAFFESKGRIIRAKADAEVKRIEAHTEADITMIRATADGEAKIRSAIDEASAKNQPVDPDFMARAKSTNLGRIFRQQQNKDAIGQRVLELVTQNPPERDAESTIDEDWLDVFTRHAETKSNEKFRELFARLLAGEIRRPGSFSPGTVETLARLTPKLAQDFAELCCITSGLSNGKTVDSVRYIISSPFGQAAENGLSPVGFDYIRLTALQDAGLLQADLDSQWSIPVAVLAGNSFQCGGRQLKITVRAPDEFARASSSNFKWNATNLSLVGRELVRLVDLSCNEAYEAKLREWLSNSLKPFGLDVAP